VEFKFYFYFPLQMHRPTLREIDLVRHRETTGDAIYKHPVMPGFEGYIPRLIGKFGRRYAVHATEGLAEHEREQIRLRTEAKKMAHKTALQMSADCYGRSLGDRSVKIVIYHCIPFRDCKTPSGDT
jgi:hypothetical protein